MEAKELRKKEKKELLKLLSDTRGEIFELRASRTVGSLPDGSGIQKKRREVAKIKTVLKEKEILDEAARRKEKKG